MTTIIYQLHIEFPSKLYSEIMGQNMILWYDQGQYKMNAHLHNYDTSKQDGNCHSHHQYNFFHLLSTTHAHHLNVFVYNYTIHQSVSILMAVNSQP